MEETTRQKKINRLLQKEFGEIFLLHAKKTPGTLISVSVVRVSPDLGLAKIYLSIFPSEKGPEILENIKAVSMSIQIRHDLAQRIRHQLRVVPELAFYIDDSLDYLDKIDELLKK